MLKQMDCLKIIGLLFFKTHLWPHIVQFSWLVYDTKKKIIDVHNYIVKIPDNVDLPEESVKIHKITRKDTQEQGVNISYILKKVFKRLFKL